MRFCPFLGYEGVPHSRRKVVLWFKTQRREVDIIEAFVQDFVMGRRDATNLEDQKRKTGCFGIHFCSFLGYEGVLKSPRSVVC